MLTFITGLWTISGVYGQFTYQSAIPAQAYPYNPQQQPAMLMRNIMNPVYHQHPIQNNNNAAQFLPLLSSLGQSFQQHSQSNGIQPSFNNFWQLFQNSYHQHPPLPQQNLFSQLPTLLQTMNQNMNP